MPKPLKLDLDAVKQVFASTIKQVNPKKHDLDAVKQLLGSVIQDISPEDLDTLANQVMEAASQQPAAGAGGDGDPAKTPDPAQTEDFAVEPVDGKCEDGYQLSEDGTMCVKQDAPPAEVANAILKFLKNKHSNPHSQTPTNDKPQHKIGHAFKWAVPLTVDDPTELMLVKGVAMSEGTAKRGEIMTKNNIVFGAGAMSTAAMMGVAPIDIDHYEEQLPPEYEKEFGKAINDPYPVGYILDAAAEENDGVMQVEYIAAITNPLVYRMIQEGKFVGNSVVDWYRKENCDVCQSSDGKCGCSIEGSHFLVNTLVLKGVPNSNGTWVAPITKEDMGTLITPATEAELHTLKAKELTNPQLRAKHSILLVARKNHSANILDEYTDNEGKFTDGKAGIQKFLIDEKGLSENKARDLAEFLYGNPAALSQDQFEFMSGSDLVAWFDHITLKNTQAAIKTMAKNIAQLNMLKHNYEGLLILRNVDQLGKGEVVYGPAQDPAKSCGVCRWFSGMIDQSGQEGNLGYCAIVSGDIMKSDTCERFETVAAPAPAAAPTDQPPAEPAPAANKAEHTIKKVRPYIAIEKNPAKSKTDVDQHNAHLEDALKHIKQQDGQLFIGRGAARRFSDHNKRVHDLQKKRLD